MSVVLRRARLLVSVLVAALVSIGILTASPRVEAASIGAMDGAGPRPNATRLKFKAGDRVTAHVDVGSGNLYVSMQGLALQGVGGEIGLNAYYNSAAASLTPVPRLGKGWGIDYSTDVRVVRESDNSVTYYGPGGWTGNFPLVSGSTTNYTSAKGFKSDLVKTSSGWTLTDRRSKIKRAFDTAGGLVSVEDRNGNKTTVTAATGTSSFKDLTIVSPAGPVAARTATLTTTTGGLTALRQPNVQDPRDVEFATVGGVLAQATDPLGRSTTFSYDSAGLLTSIKAPGGVLGAETNFAYDSSNRVTSITQVESSGTGPGSSTTRLEYQSGSPNKTLLASPTTNQSSAVSAVPHTTYELNSTKRVEKVTDAQGRDQKKTYTANFDTLSQTVGTTGSESTTSNTYGANGGESLTKSTSPTGASQSWAYTNPAPNQYLPTKGTDDAGNNSAYTYNGVGNQLSSADASAAKADVDYNSDGTPSTAKSPNNGSNKSRYSYTDKQVTTFTPVTGTNLGVRNYTYDQYGRLASASNGRNITTTFGYDVNDRLATVDYSDGTGIAFTYTAAGLLETRTDATGTTRYRYDQLGRMLLIQNSAFGGDVDYTYNKDSRLATSSNPSSGGTIRYTYDNAGALGSVYYPSSSGEARTQFSTDSHGRRTHAWMSTTGPGLWKARNWQSYDKSDRVTRVTSDVGTGDASFTRVVDISYCYMFGSTPGSSCTANALYDRNKLEWKKDNKTGVITKYTYDTSGRLKSATQSGSGNKTFSYTYNSNGNRLTATGTGQTNQTLTYNAANQITSSGFSYDGAGNLATHPTQGSMTYTPDDQLKTVTKGGTTYQYKYGGRGNTELVWQTTPKGTYQYAYGRDDQVGNPIIEQVGKDNLRASVISDPTTGQPLILQTASGLQAMLVYDGRPGSPIALVASGSQALVAYDYNPFGVPTVTANNNGEVLDQNPYTFARGIADRTTGWVHYAARYYDPTTGSFTQQDTLDAPLDPKNGNRYAYAGNDPMNNTDPTGQYVPIEVCWGFTVAIEGVVGLAAGFGGAVAGFGMGGLAGYTANRIDPCTTNTNSNSFGDFAAAPL